MALPNPVFEGSEKRVEIDFSLSHEYPRGLRTLTRPQLDELMDLAHCTIVSSRSNADLDAYVLSESSLFVYPTKWILKTCGTTRLLHSVPRLLEMAASLGMAPIRCKFNRASFLFPEQQHFPHTAFEDEVEFLEKHLGHLGSRCSVLGDYYEGHLQWHVYEAGSAASAPRPTYNLEVCMTELGAEAAQQFFRNDKFVSAEQTTKETGIAMLKPGAVIDDYVFEPCGYSMNGIDGTGLITIHVTPEAGQSYASIEVSGFAEDMVDPTMLLNAATKIFQPSKMILALSVDTLPIGDADPNAIVAPPIDASCLEDMFSLPAGYHILSATQQPTEAGGSVAFFSLSADERMAQVAAVENPKSVIKHVRSFLSFRANSMSLDYNSLYSDRSNSCSPSLPDNCDNCESPTSRGGSTASGAAAPSSP